MSSTEPASAMNATSFLSFQDVVAEDFTWATGHLGRYVRLPERSRRRDFFAEIPRRGKHKRNKWGGQVLPHRWLPRAVLEVSHNNAECFLDNRRLFRLLPASCFPAGQRPMLAEE